MKSLFSLLVLSVLFSSFTIVNKAELTEAERKFAVDHLIKTRDDLINAVKGLSDAQLNFKPAPDRWSVLECAQHIALTSQGLFGFVQQTLQTPNDSALKATVTDEQFIGMVEDRSHKAQAAEPFKPVHAPYKTLDETLNAFNAGRDSLINYVQTTHDDLRGHIAELPFAKIDAYQAILLVSAHTNRHTQQIEEVKADPNFPKQ
ncbi:DinB family protein [Parafilimonas terrae]|uniref:DinB superfamily protein n=1 Tax=Parafilimonas terrae TaxID=1465490 RepID=A0A1I5ZDQ2_9BACT|nr:DinB family protein [Parafilimonas terrae]SFQ54606.1 DinB superfamily protein [Parafilimonas terrae]